MNQSNKLSGKIRVAVLYGGRSAEHEVSIRSAANVIQYLDKSIFEVIPIGIDKQGSWFLGHDIFAKSLEHETVHQLTNDHTWFTPKWVGEPVASQQKNLVLSPPSQQAFDVVFPVVHGVMCEDGSLQGLLEQANLPYVGCGVLSSAIGMDKDVSKRLAANAGINIPPYMVIKQDQWHAHQASLTQEITEKLSFPVFVKPANTGSSIGVNKAKSVQELANAVDIAFQFDNKILIEKALNILELEVAVLESLEANAQPIVSVVGQIKPHERHGFYSYDAKYTDEDGAALLIPALIPEEVKEQAQTIARKLFHLLECEGMARVDLFFDQDTQQICFNEVNTIPGFTQISMYPKLLEASGITYSELLTHLVKLAIKRQTRKNKLKRSYAD